MTKKRVEGHWKERCRYERKWLDDASLHAPRVHAAAGFWVLFDWGLLHSADGIVPSHRAARVLQYALDLELGEAEAVINALVKAGPLEAVEGGYRVYALVSHIGGRK